MTRDALRASLERMNLSDAEIRVSGDPGRIIGIIASPDFEGQNGAIRQGKLWRHLLDQLSPDQLEQIEFVFTYTPRELAALDRGERPSA